MTVLFISILTLIGALLGTAFGHSLHVDPIHFGTWGAVLGFGLGAMIHLLVRDLIDP